jgi:recombination protein RecR
MQDFSSKLFENAVNQIAKLPGIGRRTAVRLALFLLKQSREESTIFTKSIEQMRNHVLYCRLCHNISDREICDICIDDQRNVQQICVVQDIRDVIAVENTQAYKGLYHVLGGIISPMDGISINDLHIHSLFERIKESECKEVIMALPATTEGETTAFYIAKQIRTASPLILITAIARGVSIGNELENTDELTLSRSIANRVSFDISII